MNWLSHIVLSGRDVDYQLGNLLADPFKGRAWEGASPSVRQGIEMHRAIDRFTDAHPVFRASTQRLGSTGRLKPVVVDLIYDHFLTLEWDQRVAEPMDEFLARFYTDAASRMADYPDEHRTFISRLISSDRLSSYGTMEGVEAALKAIDWRLSERVRRREVAVSYFAAVEREYEHLRDDFAAFFPRLVSFVHETQAESDDDSVLKHLRD